MIMINKKSKYIINFGFNNTFRYGFSHLSPFSACEFVEYLSMFKFDF